jgi:hypothetical protein
MHESSRRDRRGAGSPQAPDASNAVGSRSDPAAPATSRRRFLFALGASGAAALGGEASAAAAAGASSPAPARADGYRETDHVRRYYDSARH